MDHLRRHLCSFLWTGHPNLLSVRILSRSVVLALVLSASTDDFVRIPSRRDLLLRVQRRTLWQSHAIPPPSSGLCRHLLFLRATLRLLEEAGQDQGVLFAQSREFRQRGCHMAIRELWFGGRERSSRIWKYSGSCARRRSDFRWKSSYEKEEPSELEREDSTGIQVVFVQIATSRGGEKGRECR